MAANENKLDTADNRLNSKLSPTYFLYGGTKRFNNIQKLFILFCPLGVIYFVLFVPCLPQASSHVI
jgi:hypothetical protein